MNPSERVLAALNLEEPDVVPIGEIGYDLGRLSSILNIPLDERMKHDERDVKMRVEVLTRFVEALDLDIVPANPSPPEDGPRIRWLDEETWIDEWGAKYRYKNGISWYVGPGLDDPEQIWELEPPDPNAPGIMDEPKLLVERFKGRRAVAGIIPGPKMPYLARGIDGYNIDLFRRPSLARRLMEMATDYNTELGKRLIEVGVDFIVMTGDVAYRRGPLVSIKHFREVFVPAIRDPARTFHRFGVPMVKHTDGYIEPIIEDLVKTGINGLHSIEPAAGMNIRSVKERFGSKICLWGGVDLSYTLSLGTREEVIKEVRDRISSAAPGGGYILSSSNSFSTAVKFENFKAMVEAGKAYGRYRPQG
ncbi:MAG: Uroporphyrinogen decarboxylase (URO-D) [Candidatus Bathyarchaeota archaeon B63]|nr:MAG: Uroporphyrinogen decarboxylase (URO-D) [Candidatus Bathyarchaeota archaeon B63]